MIIAIKANKESVDIRYNGIPKNWTRMEIQEPSSLKKVNPRYYEIGNITEKEKRSYTENCTSCVVVYEMRKRGYDVTASPYISKLKRRPESAWKNPKILSAGKFSKEEIEGFLTQQGNDSRVQIIGLWNKRGNEGHTFVAELDNGNIVFLDPQSGNVYNDDILNCMNSIDYWRIDNLELSDRGVSACVGCENW